METLGYGAHLIIDGFLADPAHLADADRAETLLRDLAALLEPKGKPLLTLHPDERGLSGAALLAEAHLTVHTFSDLGALALSVFSRRGIDPKLVTERLEALYGLRRFESHLKNHGRTMAKGEAQRHRALRGDRQYARTRLKDQTAL